MWDIILDLLNECASEGVFDDATGQLLKDTTKALTGDKKVIADILEKVLTKDHPEIYEKMQKLLRRRMNRTRNSNGNPNKVKSAWKIFLEEGKISDIRKVCSSVLRRYMTTHMHCSASIVDRACEALEKTKLFKTTANRHKDKAPNKIYYLTNTHHSDDAIYYIQKIDCFFGLTCDMNLHFMSSSKVYTYHNVPVLIFAIMTMIPLTYYTKNGYLAGAWNFFWYSCITKGIVHTNARTGSNPRMAFYHGHMAKHDIKLTVRRLKQAHYKEPIHENKYHNMNGTRWFRKYLYKPWRFKR